MEKKKSNLATNLLLVSVIIIVVMAGLIYIQKIETDKQIAQLEAQKAEMEDKINNLQGKIDSVSNIVNNMPIEENIVLYKGMEISKKVGFQPILDMKVNNESLKKYNTTYYNYENGKYEGTTVGDFGEETYQGYSVVSNVKNIAMTQKYNAIPREYQKLEEIPNKIYSEIEVEFANAWGIKVDLDGDKLDEYIIVNNIGSSDHKETNEKYEMISKVMLYDNELNKIANLVTLTDDYIDEYAASIELEMINFIDIDNDGNMEIIIEIPAYEGINISVLKYNDNKVEGKVNIEANLRP